MINSRTADNVPGKQEARIISHIGLTLCHKINRVVILRVMLTDKS